MTTLSEEFAKNNLVTLEEDIESSLLPVFQSSQLTDEEIEAAELTQNYSELITVGGFTGGIKPRKPNKLEFIRVHRDWAPYRAAVIKEKLSDYYVLDQKLYPKYSLEAVPMGLYPTINRAGGVFLWPIRLPDITGALDEWNSKALDAIELAKTKWIRILVNHDKTNYHIEYAKGPLSEPVWPDDIPNMKSLLRLALKNIFIKSEDHPVILRLTASDV